jgi:hypothetical protein
LLYITDDLQLRNDLGISLDMHAAKVILRSLLKIVESRFFGFPLRDFLNWNCWLATMPAPVLDARGIREDESDPSTSISELTISIAQLNLNISCVSCTSPRMYELAELMSSPEATQGATEVVNNLLGYVSQLVGGTFLQVQLDRLLNEASRKCPHSPSYEANPKPIEYRPLEAKREEASITFLVMIGVVATGLIAVVGGLVLAIRCFVRHRHRKWLGSLRCHRAFLILRRQERERQMEFELNATTKSIFRSPEVPVYARWLMPVVILGNTAFFLSGHLSLGATVNIVVSLFPCIIRRLNEEITNS